MARREPEPKYGKRPDGAWYLNPLYVWPPLIELRERNWQVPGACCLLFTYRSYNHPQPLVHIHDEEADMLKTDRRYEDTLLGEEPTP